MGRSILSIIPCPHPKPAVAKLELTDKSGRNLEINSMSQNNHAVPIHTQTIFLKFWNVGTTSCRDYAPNARYSVSNQDACVDTVPFTCFDIMDGI
ncbi:hypothetical protein K440DRAFT_625222 [Wilcoxina mikolae CBS 423.85]|nr:hypothetical protein K440DRAFT_625222 [Wilcoxina mikolae CBS 423.85]